MEIINSTHPNAFTGLGGSKSHLPEHICQNLVPLLVISLESKEGLEYDQCVAPQRTKLRCCLERYLFFGGGFKVGVLNEGFIYFLPLCVSSCLDQLNCFSWSYCNLETELVSLLLLNQVELALVDETFKFLHSAAQTFKTLPSLRFKYLVFGCILGTCNRVVLSYDVKQPVALGAVFPLDQEVVVWSFVVAIGVIDWYLVR